MYQAPVVDLGYGDADLRHDLARAFRRVLPGVQHLHSTGAISAPSLRDYTLDTTLEKMR